MRKENAIQDTYLARIFGPEKAMQLMTKFFADLSCKVDLLTKYLEDKNTVEIRKIAHQLKGSGKSYGFNYITEVGIELSSCSKQEDYSGLGDLVNSLITYVGEQKKILFEQEMGDRNQESGVRSQESE